MACGRPVVALNRGGATETVDQGITGWLVDAATADDFAAGMAMAMRHPVDPARLVNRADRFALPRFEQEAAALIASALAAGPQC
jgi:hypothetical protein